MFVLLVWGLLKVTCRMEPDAFQADQSVSLSNRGTWELNRCEYNVTWYRVGIAGQKRWSPSL